MSFKISHSGSFARLEKFLGIVPKLNVLSALEAAGKQGVAALSAHTPVESGLAAHSWSYRISSKGGVYTVEWTNSDVEDGFPVVVMLQYGYGTGTGGYVQGRDFINPAMKPIFNQVINDVWKAVTSA